MTEEKSGAAEPTVSTPVVDFVRRYQAAEISRLHMPGHKGVPFLGCEPWDITEIKGADELYEAEGILAESEANATTLFGTQHSYYATEGSSQCIRAMLYLAMQGARAEKTERPLLLAARNAHKALIYACALLDADVEWLWPETDGAAARGALDGQGNENRAKCSAAAAPDSLCRCPVSAKQAAAALARLAATGRLPFALYVTSPDYLGGMRDVYALAQVCRAWKLPLLVDNAHGAYLRFLPENRHPIALGAAMCCDSGHKTLPVLTGGAYLHIGDGAPACAKNAAAVRNALCLFGSTSPSYLILQSLDLCNRYLSQGYPARLAACCARVAALRMRLEALCAGVTVRTAEPLKLVLDAAALGCPGRALAERLRAERVECEYADDRNVVLMFTPENPPRDAQRIAAALQKAVQAAGAGSAAEKGGTAWQKDRALRENRAPAVPSFAALAHAQKTRCSIREAVLSPHEELPLAEALGRVCALPSVACPPAIPIVVSGEEVTPEALAVFRRYGIEKVDVVAR